MPEKGSVGKLQVAKDYNVGGEETKVMFTMQNLFIEANGEVACIRFDELDEIVDLANRFRKQKEYGKANPQKKP